MRFPIGNHDEYICTHKLRTSKNYLPKMHLVAEKEGEIIGNILYTVAWTEDETGARQELLTFGPLSVEPSCQKQGIGSALLGQSLAMAKQLSYPGIVIFGHPDYYARFGFGPAKAFDITTSDGQTMDAQMALELKPGQLKRAAGRFSIDEGYSTTPEEREEWGKRFSQP